MRFAHLSRCSGPADGGIAQAVDGLLRAQQGVGDLDPHWLTPEQEVSFAAAVDDLAPELLHVHGLWRAPTRLAARLQARLPVVVAPHGMLDPWAFAQHRRRKTLLWWAYECRCLQRAAALQALCPAEAQALRALGLTAPIALIPNGVALPSNPGEARSPLWSGTIPAGAPVLLFLGRFDHKKGLEPLLTAWESVALQACRASWWLALVGYGDDGQLQRQLAAQPIANVYVGGPVFDDEKAAVFSAASAFVLPSYSEGLPMAALEAMAHRLPCLLSAACNLPEAFDAGAALNADPDSFALSNALLHLFALSPAERDGMGAAGQAHAAAHYSWPRVAERTRDLYQWVIGGGDRPGFMELF